MSMNMTEIISSQFKKLLSSRRNLLVFGPSGWGKTATVEEYARENGLKIAYVDLAGQLPESVAGIPTVMRPRIKVTEVKDYSKEIGNVKKELKKLNDCLLDLTLKQTSENFDEIQEKILQTINKMETLQEELKALNEQDGEEETYYRRMLDVELKEFLECEGEGWILLFDEINQGTPDVQNTLYSIAHPIPSMRRWCGHRIGKCQIVALGNLSDGTDGTVYLTDLPTPLLNRFFCFKLKPNKSDATKYLKKKYKDLPRAEDYIKAMLEQDIAPRDIDLALDVLQTDDDALFLEAKLGTALTAKIYDLQKKVKNIDPTELLENARKLYAKFKEKGKVIIAHKVITTEEGLKEQLKRFISEEEIASIFKGGNV